MSSSVRAVAVGDGGLRAPGPGDRNRRARDHRPRWIHDASDDLAARRRRARSSREAGRGVERSFVIGTASRHSRRRDHAAVEAIRTIAVGNEQLPFDNPDRQIHTRQRHLHRALLRERCAGVQVHERHRVGAIWPEPGSEQRHADAIAPFDRLGGATADVGRQHRRAGRQRDLHERLRAIADPQRHLGQRPSLAGNQRRRHRAIGRSGEDRRIGEALYVERQQRRAVGRALVTKRGEQRLPRDRRERRGHLADIHAAHARNVGGRDVECSGAFDRDLAGLALGGAHRGKGRLVRERSTAGRSLERDQELMAML